MPIWTIPLWRARLDDQNGYIIYLDRSSYEGSIKYAKEVDVIGSHANHAHMHDTCRELSGQRAHSSARSRIIVIVFGNSTIEV
jgi:hypothetical protein